MLSIIIWDVGHGNAAYIRTPNDRHIVVDLGDTDGFSPLESLRESGIPQLDAAVITHPHRDHLDDISHLTRMNPTVLWRPQHLSEAEIRGGNRFIDTHVIDRYLEISRNYNLPMSDGIDPTVPDNLGGADFKVFAPRCCSTDNLNNHSLVVVLSYAGLKIVLPGDNEAPSWGELIEDPGFVNAVKGTDVLLASHHGRDAGYCADLFTIMGKPKLVVISDGRFGDTSATSRYSAQATGWTVKKPDGSSDECKCVTTRSNGHITLGFGWSQDPRYKNFLSVNTTK